MIRELRLILRLMPVVKKLFNQLENTEMKLSVNAVIQLLGTAMQGLVAVTELLPPKGKLWAHVAMSAIQGIAGVLAHFVNPDGSKAETAYKPN